MMRYLIERRFSQSNEGARSRLFYLKLANLVFRFAAASEARPRRHSISLTYSRRIARFLLLKMGGITQRRSQLGSPEQG
ncbi:MAG: hypothetical protein ACI9P7_001824 [Candidatus Azotimanducaceae bacterium]|jgi:hypothetical protein